MCADLTPSVNLVFLQACNKLKMQARLTTSLQKMHLPSMTCLESPAGHSVAQRLLEVQLVPLIQRLPDKNMCIFIIFMN